MFIINFLHSSQHFPGEKACREEEKDAQITKNEMNESTESQLPNISKSLKNKMHIHN